MRLGGFIFILLALFISVSASASKLNKQSKLKPDNIGITSQEGEDFLWKDGVSSYNSNDYSAAIYAFSRIVSRYPASANYLEANRLLGQAYFLNNQPEKALEPLKHFISIHDKNLPALKARLWLARSYLQLKKFREAYFTTLEILMHETPKTHDLETQQHAVLLQADALIGLNEDKRAKLLLEPLWKKLLTTLFPNAKLLELRLKLRDCARLPDGSSLDESQIQLQMVRRGECLLESTMIFFNIVQKANAPWTEDSLKLIERGYKDFYSVCIKPPVPNYLKGKEQKKRYQNELRLWLDGFCKDKLATTLEFVKDKSKVFPPNSRIFLQKLAKSLIGLK